MVIMPDECIHYWDIEMAGGPTSNGICRKCGAERVFDNMFSSRDYQSSAARNRPSGFGEGRSDWMDYMFNVERRL